MYLRLSETEYMTIILLLQLFLHSPMLHNLFVYNVLSSAFPPY